MAGANGIAKFLRVNREDEAVDFKQVGISFMDPQAVSIVGNTITATQMFQNLLFTALTSNNLTGPTAADIYNILSLRAKGNTGEQWTIQITNTDSVSKTITWPTGFVDATGTPMSISLVIPANTTQDVTFKLFASNFPNVTPGAPLFQIVSPPLTPTGTYIPFPAGVINLGDVLIWDGTAWVQTSSVSGLAAVPFAPFINKATAQPATLNDFLVWNGTDWVSTTQNPNGNVTNLFVDNITPRAPFVQLTVNQGQNFINNTNAYVPTYTNAVWNFNQVPHIPNGTIQNPVAVMQIEHDGIVPVGAFDDDTTTLLMTNLWDVSAPIDELHTNHIICRTGGATAGVYAAFPTQVFKVTDAGTVFALAFSMWSDIRIKKDISAVDSVTFEDLDKIRCAKYRYVNQKDTDPLRVGVIAQDIEQILPEAVIHQKGETDLLTVDLTSLISLGFAFSKTLKAKILEQENLIKALAARVSTLEAADH